MDKLKMHSVNKVDENVAKIGKLFPNCVTERKKENGEVEYAVDFDMLRQELSSVVVEGNEERYHSLPGPTRKRPSLLPMRPFLPLCAPAVRKAWTLIPHKTFTLRAIIWMCSSCCRRPIWAKLR